jgi:hypothetical protein
MRVAISSTTGLDRKGTIDCFLLNWSSYTTEAPWKKILSENAELNQLDLNKKLLVEMKDHSRRYGRDDNIIFNRCTLDVMAYILWGRTEDPGLYTDDYVDDCIEIFKESTKYIDIMFYMPLSRVSGNLKQSRDVVRIDECFKFLQTQYNSNVNRFFVHDDKPAVIELLGNIEEQIHIIKLYLNDEGGIDDGGDDILPPEVLDLISTENLDVSGEINDLLKTK